MNHLLGRVDGADGEKRKYFRVQANHYAVAPANAKYTKEKVDQIKRDDKVRRLIFGRIYRV